MLQTAELLKHKLLIGLIYGCGLRCMEVRNIELRHLDFDRKMLHIVQGKGRKDRYVPLSEHLIRGLKTFIKVENPVQYLFNGNQNRNVEEIDQPDSGTPEKLFSKNWVVYAKRPFGGPKQVIVYLGRYTHKVAISNHRIKEVTDKEVRFAYKDYRKGDEKKEMTLSNVEFIRRFSLHILPKRFVRIRHYGILSSSWTRGKL